MAVAPALSPAPPASLRTPVLLAAAGAGAIAFSSIFVKLAAVSPETAAFFRCLYALPVLWLFAAHERRRGPSRAPRNRPAVLVASLSFGCALLFWHHTIADVGAGLATVLANVQVVLVPLAAWLVLGERPPARVVAILPAVLAGVVLVSGALEQRAYGDEPLAGVAFGLMASLCYVGCLLGLRQANRLGDRPAGSLLDATAGATVICGAYGLAGGALDLAPPTAAQGWLVLLALTAQACGWLLLARSLPSIGAALASVIILIQPVGSVLLALAILGERPSPWQLSGVAVIAAGIVVAGSGARR